MSVHHMSITTASSGNSQDTGYKTGPGLTSSTPRTGQEGESGQGEKEKVEMEAREKLKEELLRQYEAGQLGPPHHQSARLTSVPRQIPTIEENRAHVKRMSTLTVSRPTPSSYLPDLTRPPPGYCRLQPPPIQLYHHQSHPLHLPSYSYEENLVTRILQSLVTSVPLQPAPAELPPPVTPGPLDKVLNWNTKHELSPLSHRSRSHPRSFSRERLSQTPLRSRRSPSYWSAEYKRHRRSVSRGRERRESSERSRPRYRYHHSRRDQDREDCDRRDRREYRKDRDRREHVHRDDGRDSDRRDVRKGHDRRDDRSRRDHVKRSVDSRSRDWSPGTRYYASPERDRGYKRARSHDSSPERQHSSLKRQRGYPERKIQLSPRRSDQSVRDVINSEKDSRPSYTEPKSCPPKKKVKDRLGPKPSAITEIFNMDRSLGKVGGVAIVKEYVDNKMGLLELRTCEGGRGSIILFSVEQVWVSDRKRNQNGPPIPFTQGDWDQESLPKLLPLGLEVLVNGHKVRSDFIDLQATVIWPKFTDIPNYKLVPSKLEADHSKFRNLCRFKKMTPICINGSLNIWSAKVLEILDQDWGLIEVSSYPRDAKREFSYKFICFFHKEDVWLDDGLCVRDHQFYREKDLSAIVELRQPVNLVARSIIKEKGQFMKKSTSTTVSMQALCVSLLPWAIPRGAPLGSRVEGGPGAFGGCNRGETPYIFKPNYHKHLNFKLAKFLTVYKGKIVVDPEIEAKLPSMKAEGIVKSQKKTDEKTKNSCQQTDLLSNVEAIIREAPGEEGFGLAEVLSSGWKCLFHSVDCVAAEDACQEDQFKVRTKVHLNANLVDKDQAVQYVASCVWRKTESSLALPNIIDKSKISRSKLDKLDSLNQSTSEIGSSELPSQIEDQDGVILKIMDDNFGIISQAGLLILFDTCDFWTETNLTAARANLNLRSIVSVGEEVVLHAALVSPEAQVPYLATAVWKKVNSPFSPEDSPRPILRSKIHQDKIRIYQTVSSSSTVTDSPELKSSETKSRPREELFNVSGTVKFGIRLNRTLSTSAGIVEIGGHSLGWFLSSESVEYSEESSVCVPGRKVWLHATPVPPDFLPVTHLVTLISSLHSSLPEPNNLNPVFSRSIKVLSQVKENFDLMEFVRRKPEIICCNLTSLNPSKMVSNCKPSGRLVCMTSPHSGILEDHMRQLTYFEVTDTNLPSALTMKDVALIMSRCRDVAIRFQASNVLDGPVKMVVHDGTVAISSNLKKFYPEVKLKKSQIKLKPNSFSGDKLLRAKEAAELYKEGKVLVCEDIVESSEYPSLLLSSKSYHIIEDDPDKKSTRSVGEGSEEQVKSICQGNGILNSILNEHFGLIEFSLDSRKSFCLFDTYDLYLAKGKTAAMLKLSVDRVVTKGQQISFNAYEISPRSSVPWLANGVWRSSLKTPPRPVLFTDISKEKISVFEKVSETCASVLPSLTFEDKVETVNHEDTSEDVKGKLKEEADDEDKNDSLPKVLDERVEVLRVTKSEQDFTIVTLQLESKEEVKCLVHLAHVWTDGRPVEVKSGWRAFKRATSLNIKARRIFGNKQFDYQASSAILTDGSRVSTGRVAAEEDLDKLLEEYNVKPN